MAENIKNEVDAFRRLHGLSGISDFAGLCLRLENEGLKLEGNNRQGR